MPRAGTTPRRTPIRALLRAPRSTGTSIAVHEGLEALLATRTADGVWGYSRHGPSDVTFTCFVLHAFVEAQELWGISSDGLDLERATAWLAGQRQESGYWRDWQGIEHSPEATAYALLVLAQDPRPRRGPRDARACSPCSPSSTTGSGRSTTAAAAPG